MIRDGSALTANERPAGHSACIVAAANVRYRNLVAGIGRTES